MTSMIQSAVAHMAGKSGYTCVEKKGHLDNCKDLHGICETNSICRFLDDIKRRGKLDKKTITYSEANNTENGVDARSSFELIFNLDYDAQNGNRVTLFLTSPTVYEFDVSKYKYNKIVKLLDQTLLEFADEKQKFNIHSPYEAYTLIGEIIHNNKKKFLKLRKALAKKIEPLIKNNFREFIDSVLKHSVEKKFNKSLTIENINESSSYIILQGFINNIKQDLLREYTSPNRHIVPPLNMDFVSGVNKHDYVYDIEYPQEYFSGGKKPKKTRKRSHKKKYTRRHVNNRRHNHMKKSRKK